MSLNRKASVLFLICVGLFLMLSTALGFLGGADPNLFYLLNSIAVSVPSFLIPALVFRRRNAMPRFEAPRGSLILLALGIGIGCIFLNQALSCLTEVMLGDIRVISNSTTADSIKSLHPITMIAALALIPPVSEEFLMRGTLLESQRRLSPAGALIITSLLFGLLHAAPSSLLIYVGLGLLLGGVYIITGNVWLSVTVHLVNNLFSVIAAIIMQASEDLPGAAAAAEESAELASNTGAYIIMFFVYAGLACAALIPLLKVLKNVCRRHSLGMYSPEAQAEAAAKAELPPEIRRLRTRTLLHDPVLWAAIILLVILNVISGLIEFGVIRFAL
ncbi:MAG: CPBP family intramembrane metalloprotease [Clostridia bacterium]|nr:CPBP family intramembrane metalloprotease [Clostridia bacterium]